jgi:hypothetical protein
LLIRFDVVLASTLKDRGFQHCEAYYEILGLRRRKVQQIMQDGLPVRLYSWHYLGLNRHFQNLFRAS